MNYKNILQNTLSQEATLMVNKKLMAKYGLELASLVAYLIDQERYYDGEEFYCRDTSIKLYTGINIDRISTIKKIGVEKGLFKIVRKGMPISSYYYINHKVILEEISSDDSVSDLAYGREVGDVEFTRENILKMSRDNIRLLSRKLGVKYSGKEKKSTLVTNLIDFLQLPENPVTNDGEILSLVTDISVTSDGYIPLNKETKYLETKNKETVVAIEQDPAAASDETFLKNLKELLIKNNFQNYNSQTLKNIKEFSNGNLNEVEKVLEFMKLKNKAINSKILVAILKDGDHKVVEPVDLKKVTRADKVAHMLKITAQDEVDDLCDQLAKSFGYERYNNLNKTDENIVNIALENIFCKRYNKLHRGN
ncbi:MULTISPECIES: hypothetical protein [Psychrilyobacter]|uniref:Rho termination factor N-terminal domain-containing protein n=1 Tax=Psychrilyobacter piezotolerans TaxID=2293438 RepID=A0ABX9KJA2_9FUSO|nr:MULTISPECIES: hypothetical protein [Psychrilyobacter]MCS5421884.1 hypothetical protein [Psychrilyobacter sp. S5]NDI76961.1 hypothetical protein [Psychrilyobacter piezotolerans]RDE64581.1 hypothetical protein DV867_03305 [Psychrilyobacter sp. S5]REI42393.1 hypothetical protein DYH56_03305 [Psychrilyobacter piezotolerans]